MIGYMSDTQTNTTAEELRAEAARLDDRAAESFDRCDTDGALSQWSATATAMLRRAEAALIDDGGRHNFPCLFTLDGDIVPSRLRSGRYGQYWTIEDGGTVNHPKRMATLEAKGYRVGIVNRPAGVDQSIPFLGAPGVCYRYPKGDWVDARIVHTGAGFTRTADAIDLPGGGGVLDARPVDRA
jgi:hypothetical protein